MEQVPLEVVGVRVELPSNQPVLILRGGSEELKDHRVAVVVGPAEAAAVARALQGEIPVRPMTHDLLTHALENLGGGVASVEVGLLDESTYCGTIRLAGGQTLDARASDALAVAVRAKCPLTMNKQTLLQVAVTPQRSEPSEQESISAQGPISEDEIAEFHRFLDQAGPEDFQRHGQ